MSRENFQKHTAQRGKPARKLRVSNLHCPNVRTIRNHKSHRLPRWITGLNSPMTSFTQNVVQSGRPIIV